MIMRYSAENSFKSEHRQKVKGLELNCDLNHGKKKKKTQQKKRAH